MCNKFIPEIVLFQDGVKPAIFDRPSRFVHMDLCYFHTKEFRNGIIVSRKEINIHNNIDLGILLGYYPESCKLLYSNAGHNDVFLNFGGIKFNTAGLYKEALRWCKEVYAEPMLQLYKSAGIEIYTIKNTGEKNIIFETIIRKGA